MNKLPVYLYSNKLDVILDLDQNRGIHTIMYQRKLKIQKGFKDSIQIQFKNSDQKPVSISTSTNYWFDMIDSSGRQLVLTKQLTVLDDSVTTSTRGTCLASFDPVDTINLTAASYKFLIKQDNGDGTFTPAYSNTYYGITGEVEVVEDGFAIGFPVQTVSSKQLEQGQEYNRDPAHMGYFFYSGWYRPWPNAMTVVTPQSCTIALNNFKGTITVQGSLDNNPSPAGSANAQSFVIASAASVTPTTGNIQLSWNTNLTAVRFVIQPDADGFGSNYYPTGNPIGSNLNKFPSGFIDQIQYFS